MPRTLDETYERMLAAIEDLYFDEARAALEWLVFTNAPLSIAELAEACSISYTSETVPFLKNGGHADIIGLLNVLGNLILVGDLIPYYSGTDEIPDPPKYNPEFHQRQVRLSHFSVQEYLISDRLRESAKDISTYALHEVESSFDLAQRCCAYLMYFVSEPSPQVQKWIDDEYLPLPDISVCFHGSVSCLDHWERFEPQYPLLGYCSRQWTEHLKVAENSMGATSEEKSLHLQVLEQERVTATWLRLGQTDRSLKGQPEERYWFRSEKGMEKNGWNDKTRALYWAPSFRLPKTVSLLCDLLSCQDRNYEDGKTGTALQASAYWGNVALVKALLERGSNVNLRMGPHGSPLQAAAKGGFTEIVSILLEAALNQGMLRTCMDNTVPHNDIRSQSMQTLKSFLKTVDIISDDDSPQSQIFALLKSAVKDCSEAIVKHKNQAVSDVKHLSPEFQLLAAAEECEEWAGIVLEIDTAVSSVLDGLLLSAIEQNRGAVAKALIGAGAQIPQASFQEAIRLMSLDRVEGEAMAELLIYSGLNIAGDHKMLLAATSVGSAKLVKLLLETGADVHGHTQKVYNHFETKGQNFRLHTENALVTAIRREDVDMVQLLLDWAADPNEEFTLSISSHDNESVVECRITVLAITVYLAFTSSICTKTGNAIVQRLIAAGVNVDAIGTAICQSIECSIFVNASYTLHWIKNGVIGEVVDLLSDDHTYIYGPLAATPTLCQRSHKLGYDVKRSVEKLLAPDRGSWWSLHLYIDYLQDLFGAALLSSVLIGKEEGVSLLLKKGEEAKTMDTSRACELLTAACWTYLRPKDCVKIITMLLDSLLQLRGAEDDVFEGILDGGCLKISMDRFLKPGDRQPWTARIKALVQERRASFRGGHDGNSGVESGGRVL
jgi:ankyrin repeat protein